jgi:hypothetical protein
MVRRIGDRVDSLKNASCQGNGRTTGVRATKDDEERGNSGRALQGNEGQANRKVSAAGNGER